MHNIYKFIYMEFYEDKEMVKIDEIMNVLFYIYIN